MSDRDATGRFDDEQWVSNAPFARSGQAYPAPIYQIANLTSEVGGGQYNWVRFDTSTAPFSVRKVAGARSGTSGVAAAYRARSGSW